ncbi:MAG TPA: hypothetical protein VJU18_18515 [Vicinamibacteria bacterium]|nr:hypothetical protein [Vicinamibacteria bacterium]
MAEAARTLSRLRPLLLSALVLPGLGQLAERRYVRGLLFAGAALGSGAAFVFILFRETLRRIPQDTPFLDPADAWRIAHQVVATAGGTLESCIGVLLAAWALSVLDAALSYHRSR